MIDYRALLKKYMAIVAREEGITFVDYALSADLTPDEAVALKRVEQELFPDIPGLKDVVQPLH